MSDGFTVVVSSPDGSKKTEEFGDVKLLRIGRDESCDLVLPSPAVSRFHLRVERASSGFVLVDESSNGTRVGESRLQGSAASLRPGTPVYVGPYTLLLDFVEHSASKAIPHPDVRRAIHRALLDHLDLASLDATQMKDQVLRPRVVRALEQIISAHEPVACDPASRARLLVEMTNEVLGLGPLQQLLDDEEVGEIMVVDPKTIYVERRGRLERTMLQFTDEESCRAVIERIVMPLGRRIDESAPVVDARLPDGSRVNAIIPPLAIRGPCITIRKFPQQALTMDQLIEIGSLSDAMAQFLRRCVRARKNILVSGGTGSGKTTLLNVLSREIPARERVVTIEDAAELRLEQPHVVSLEAKPRNLEGSGEYGIRSLLKNALRMRPDRILVGECRSGEAIDMLQAMNTGHEGSMTTTHANSPTEALKRIETLCMMAGLELSASAIRRQIASSLHVLVQQTRFSDGSRRITNISEVTGLARSGELIVHDIFSFLRAPGGPDRDVRGEHRPTGYVPRFFDQFITQGLIEDGEYL